MKKIKKLSGITLIETILYLGIAVVVLGVLFSYGWNVMGINIKTQIMRETNQSAQLIGEKLAYEIRRADSASISENPARLVLQIENSTVIIEESGGQIAIKRDSDEFVALNSQNIKIENFVLTKQENDSGEIQFVGFSFDAVANYAGSSIRSEYQYSLPFSSGIALRK